MYQRNGRFEKRVTFDNGETKTFYGATEREVKQKIKAYAKKLEKTSYTLDEMIEKRNEDNAADFTPATHRTESYAKKLISRELLDYDIDDLRAKQINDELKRLQRAGYSKSTINLVRHVISSAVRYAISEDFTENNPLTAVKTPPAPVKKRDGTSDEDTATIIKYRHDGEFNFLAYFTLVTGTRHGEALAVEWNDIDFEKRLIHISKTVIVGDDGRETVAPPKTDAGDRFIPMLDMLCDDLLDRKSKTKSSRVFNMSLTKSYREQIKFREDYGLSEDWSLHSNRHAFATECRRTKVDVKVAQYLLGHADITTTLQIYTDVAEDMRDEAVGQLAQGFERRKKHA